MTRILIVEDISAVANRLKKNIERLGFVCAGTANNLESARTIIRKESPDIVILDIDLNRLENGLDLAPELEKLKIPFIVLSDLNDKATRDLVLKHPPVGYLIKPITLENLQSTVELAMTSKITTALSDSFHFKQRDGFTKLIRFDDIVFLKSDHGGREVHYLEDANLSRVVDKGSLSDFVETNKTTNFVQVNRSYIVNLNYLESFTYSEIRLKLIKDFTIPIGKTFRPAIHSLLESR